MGYWEPFIGRSDEWYTPARVFDALGCRFDLDVAPARQGQAFVPADAYLEGCGLSQPWHGFVWMNPPFGGRNGLAPWLDRFFKHGNGIALTPDRTSAPWFWSAWSRSDAVLFTRKLRFIRPDGSEGVMPANSTALMAAGDRAAAALSRASKAGFGIMALPIQAPAAPGIEAAKAAETEGLGLKGESPTAESGGAPITTLNPGSGANG